MSDVNVNVEPESQPRLGEAAIRSDFLALTDEARNAIVSSKATCPFIGSAVASGLLPIRGGTEEPLAAIDDVRSLGNSGGGDLGDLLAFFASGNHARMRGADGALDALVPAGLFSLDFPGSQGSHPGHSGILESDAAARGSGRVSEAEFERLAARARDGWLSRSAVGSFIAENLRRDPRAKVFGPRTALLLARDAASFASEAGPLLMRQLHASQPGSDAHREIEEKLTRLLGEDNLVGSAGEFGLLFAFFANRPGADALDHDPTLPLADVRRMFIDKRLPDGWDRWPKRRVDWVLHTTALLVAAAKAYVLPREAAAMSTPQAPAPHDIAADVTPQHQGQAAAGVHMAPVPVLNPDRPVPRANTGSRLRDIIADASVKIMQIERRFDPFFRRPFDALLQEPLARLVTALINSRRVDEHFALAEERPIPDEEAWVQSIIDTFRQQMSGLWKPGKFERGGNTKTHGIVRGEFVVHDDLPAHLRRGIFAEPHTFRAWVRFSGPGPYITPDIDDVGFMSISIKLMGVPGPKLMDDEKFTQDMFGVSPPTFVTPDVKANAQLQKASVQNAPIFYFINLHRSHVLDLVMQSLFLKTQSSPFEAPYFSCVPYLLGAGQAMQYSVWPISKRRTPVPRLPLRPPDDYYRDAMVAALTAGDVELDFRVQVQTDPHLMPIENNAVLWPERLSPRISVATLRLPRQQFDSPAQLAFARKLSYNPWHCIAEHRPLGNQSRARKRMYWELSQMRHDMNNVPRYEPNGDEVFDEPA